MADRPNDVSIELHTALLLLGWALAPGGNHYRARPSGPILYSPVQARRTWSDALAVGEHWYLFAKIEDRQRGQLAWTQGANPLELLGDLK